MYFGKKLSVAIATYNGEKYIKEQLDSILSQTVQPDEIVISDDGSTDRTLEFLEEYRLKSIGTEIDFHIIENSGDRGYRSNFQNALEKVTGDYIFLSDQDDYWYPNKMAVLTDELYAHLEAELICHDAVVTDATGNEIQSEFASAFPRELFTHKEGNLFLLEQEIFLEKSILRTFPGMAMCFTKEFLESISPIPPIRGHDSWLFFCAISNNTAYYYPEQLGIYRIHDSNTSNPLNQKVALLQEVNKVLKMLSKPTSYSKSLFIQSNVMLDYLYRKGIRDGAGYDAVLRLLDFETRLRSAETQKKLTAVITILRLYRSGGKKQLIAHLCNVIFHSRAARIECAKICYRYTEFYHQRETDIRWNDQDITVDQPLLEHVPNLCSEKNQVQRPFSFRNSKRNENKERFNYDK